MKLSPPIVGVLLNIILALSLAPFATKSEIKPPNGASKLGFKSQIVHMLVHHGQVLVTSSMIIFAIVALSIEISSALDRM